MLLLFDYTGTDILDPLVLLLAAMLIDAYLGEFGLLFRLIPHPVVVMGHWIGVADARLNRADRTAADRRARGVIVAALLTGAAAGVGLLVQWFATQAPVGWLLELFLVAVLLAQKSLHDHVRDVATALETGGAQAGRVVIRHLVGRDPDTLDAGGIGRAAVESLAENFSDGVVAPVVWYVVFGLPGLMAYKMINTLDSMIGHRSERYRDFGWASARLDDVANWLPARLAGMLLLLSAATLPFTRAREGLRILRRDARRHRSPNAGWPEAVTAGALGLALSGPRSYHGRPTDEPWVGDGRARVGARDIRRALRLYVRACLLAGGAVAVLLVLKLATVGAG
jgi:adenosylcobinamide-phosphate synthase